MKEIHWLALISTGSAMLLSSCNSNQTLNQSSSASSVPPQPISYQTHTLANTVIHTVTIPNYSTTFLQSPVVTTALERELATIEDFAKKHQAIVAINGGFFDPKNQKTTSYIVKDGELIADPSENERLIDNPNLEPYMDKILSRSEFRRYSCRDSLKGYYSPNYASYDIVPHTEPIPNNCQLIDALGAGPAILPEDTSFEEGFVDYANGEVIRDALGSNRMNARSALGITAEGTIIFAMAAQKSEQPRNSGINLPDFAAFLKTLGVEKAMNLDGGSSASLYYQGTTIYGRVDGEGNAIQRPIKSVLIVQPSN